LPSFICRAGCKAGAKWETRKKFWRWHAKLQRAEQRERQESGIQYLVSPARVDRYIAGRG
jgi:hypothetical protein